MFDNAHRSTGRLDIIRPILSDGSMPRQRFQDPEIQQNKNGSYFIRPWVDVISKEGRLVRKKKTFVLGPVSLGARGARAQKNEVMRTINRSDYVIKAQITLGDFVKKYRENHLRLLSFAQQCKF